MKPTALILRAAGINCDRELAHAFELAGAATMSVHVNKLIDQPQMLGQIDLLGVPGGFSYGDDIAAGRIFANRLRHRLWEPLRAAVSRGVPAIGICNGFQVLVKLGLLPDPQTGGQSTTLADNTCGRFIDRWVSLRAQTESVCLWTRGMDRFDLPIAHGEGRFVPESPALLAQLYARKQVAIKYDRGDDSTQAIAFPGNPNGSVDDIAGICDPTGRVLGLMPHPERFTHATNHPKWTRQLATSLAESPAGLRFFQNAVEYVLSRQTQAART